MNQSNNITTISKQQQQQLQQNYNYYTNKRKYSSNDDSNDHDIGSNINYNANNNKIHAIQPTSQHQHHLQQYNNDTITNTTTILDHINDIKQQLYKLEYDVTHNIQYQHIIEHSKIQLYTQQINIIYDLLNNNQSYNTTIQYELNNLKQQLAIIYCNRATNLIKLNTNIEQALNDLDQSIHYNTSLYRPCYIYCIYYIQQYNNTNNIQYLYDALNIIQNNISNININEQNKLIKKQTEIENLIKQHHNNNDITEHTVNDMNITDNNNNDTDSDNYSTVSTHHTNIHGNIYQHHSQCNSNIHDNIDSKAVTVKQSQTITIQQQQFELPYLSTNSIIDYCGQYLYHYSQKMFNQHIITKTKLEYNDLNQIILHGLSNQLDKNNEHVHTTIVFDNNRIIDQTCTFNVYQIKSQQTESTQDITQPSTQDNNNDDSNDNNNSIIHDNPYIYDESYYLRPDNVCYHHGTLLLVQQYKQIKQYGSDIVDNINIDDNTDNNYLYITPKRALASTQKHKIKALQYTLMDGPRNKLVEMCKLNNLGVSGSKTELINRIIQTMTYGSAPLCPSTTHKEYKQQHPDAKYDAKLVYVGSSMYKCKGYYDVVAKHIQPCGYTISIDDIRLQPYKDIQ